MTKLIGQRDCKSCEHFALINGGPFCTRFPPQAFMIQQVVSGSKEPQIAFINTYPPINPEIPCGEYKHNERRYQELLAEERAGVGLAQ